MTSSGPKLSMGRGGASGERLFAAEASAASSSPTSKTSSLPRQVTLASAGSTLASAARSTSIRPRDACSTTRPKVSPRKPVLMPNTTSPESAAPKTAKTNSGAFSMQTPIASCSSRASLPAAMRARRTVREEGRVTPRLFEDRAVGVRAALEQQERLVAPEPRGGHESRADVHEPQPAAKRCLEVHDLGVPRPLRHRDARAILRASSLRDPDPDPDPDLDPDRDRHRDPDLDPDPASPTLPASLRAAELGASDPDRV